MDKKLFAGFLGVLLLCGLANAISNTSVSIGSNETYGSSTNAGSSGAIGGNVTNVDLTTSAQTTRWQGFWGNVTGGGIQLKNQGGSKFYAWANTLTGKQVLASTAASLNAVSHWAWNVTNATYGSTCNGTVIDYLFGYTTTFTDSGTLTYNRSNRQLTLGGTNVIAAGIRNSTWTRGAGGLDDYESVLLCQDFRGQSTSPARNDLVYSAIINASTAGFNSNTSDYQMLVPANSTALTYYFFLELT